MKRCSLLLAALLWSLIAIPVEAHESRPIFVRVTEAEPGVFNLYWKIPLTVPLRALPAPVMPEVCTPQGEAVIHQYADAYVGQQRYRCTAGLSGQALGMLFPVINPSITTLFQVTLLNGERHAYLLKPGKAAWTVPEGESKLGVAKQFAMLGIEHIWGGLDHLLFVACLLLVARTRRKILITITGFTLAHSLTLALSALDLVRVPVPPVEAAIALSIVFLAVEIGRGDRSSLTFRYPIAVSTSFGLLHGFGFATVLREIGLPQTELPTALLFFNVGVEIGQIMFVGVLVGVYLLLKALAERLASASSLVDKGWSALPMPASYVIGGVASYWMIDRIMGFWM